MMRRPNGTRSVARWYPRFPTTSISPSYTHRDPSWPAPDTDTPRQTAPATGWIDQHETECHALPLLERAASCAGRVYRRPPDRDTEPQTGLQFVSITRGEPPGRQP